MYVRLLIVNETSLRRGNRGQTVGKVAAGAVPFRSFLIDKFMDITKRITRDIIIFGNCTGRN